MQQKCVLLIAIALTIWLIVAPESDQISFADSSATAKALLAIYAAKVGKAANDTTDYTSLTGILNTTEGRAIYYYSNNPVAGYLNEFKSTYRISLKAILTIFKKLVD